MESIETINLKQLATELKALGVPKTYYSIGANKNERTCIVFNGVKWVVYYSERGRMEQAEEFNNFADARAEFIKQVT
ncbi:hypothetical protein SB766_02820 [Pseudomonas sp. SIMBA_077]